MGDEITVDPAKARPDLFSPLTGTPPSGNSVLLHPFWLVICTEANKDGRGNTTLTRGYKFVHESEDSAETEAWRLANKFPEFEFAIVKSIAAVSYKRDKRRLVWEECK